MHLRAQFPMVGDPIVSAEIVAATSPVTVVSTEIIDAPNTERGKAVLTILRLDAPISHGHRIETLTLQQLLDNSNIAFGGPAMQFSSSDPSLIQLAVPWNEGSLPNPGEADNIIVMTYTLLHV
jgi:hypothetical protein